MSKQKGPNKRDIIFRLVEVPDKGRRPFFAREMKLLNDLCDRYSLEFMDIVDFGRKIDSMAYYKVLNLKALLMKSSGLSILELICLSIKPMI